MSLRDFTHAYIDAALWSSTDDNGTPLDSLDASLSAEARAQMEADCAAFYTDCRPIWDGLTAYTLTGTVDDAQAGHDFWLTRNRHGAGFWDRGLGDAGEELTRRARAYGEADLYVSDAGVVEHFPNAYL